jgi:hypothetical protein
MKRRSLDTLLNAGLFLAAALLVAVGFVLNGNATVTENYIHHQLAAQGISFPPADTLTAAELDRPCVAANAGKYVLTAAQARCYADDFLGLHIETLVERGTPKEQLFRGDTQRGLLLTSSMFDEIGDRSRSLANIFYVAAALMTLIALAGVVHRKTVADEAAAADTLAARGLDTRRQAGVSGAGRPDPVQRRVLHRGQWVGHGSGGRQRGRQDDPAAAARR